MRAIVLALAAAAALFAQPAKRVWIDTDPSVERGGHEVDDGVALLQAFASRELDIRGVSIVFGNTGLPAASRIGREIIGKFGPKSLAVYDGAAGREELGKETNASRAIAEELRRGRLTILLLGPATNVATVLRNHPQLAKNIDAIIAVAARRPGQAFKSGASQRTPFRDLNFELDPEAFQVFLDSSVPLVFTPWEISSKVWLTRDDVQAAARSNPGMAWLLPAATDWLDLWKREFGVTGFNPFDALAVGYLVDRKDLDCEAASAVIEQAPDDTSPLKPAPQKPYLLARPAAQGKRAVTYCSTPKPAFKTDLLRHLSKAPAK